MQKLICIMLCLVMVLSLCGCGKKKTEPAAEGILFTESTHSEGYHEVQITMANLFDYFEYKEYRAATRSEDGEKVTSVQVSYGLKLKDGYEAANLPEHKDTMQVTFTAQGIVNKGEYEVNFSTLQYTGTTSSTEEETVTQTLAFWPQGNRTITYQYGNYSDTYILYLQQFTITSASGSIYLLDHPAAEPQPE